MVNSCSIAQCGPAALLLKAVFSEIFSVQCSAVQCGDRLWTQSMGDERVLSLNCYLKIIHCSAVQRGGWLAG